MVVMTIIATIEMREHKEKVAFAWCYAAFPGKFFADNYWSSPNRNDGRWSNRQYKPGGSISDGQWGKGRSKSQLWLACPAKPCPYSCSSTATTAMFVFCYAVG